MIPSGGHDLLCRDNEARIISSNKCAFTWNPMMTLLDHLSRSPATRGLKTDHLSDLENGYAIATPSPASGPAKTV